MEQAVGRITDGLAVAEAAGTTRYVVSSMVQVICDGIMLNRLETLLAHEEMSQQIYQTLYDSLRGHREKRAGSLLAGFRSERCDSIRRLKKAPEDFYTQDKFLKRWPFATFMRWRMLHGLRSQSASVEMAKKPYWEIDDAEESDWKRFITKGAKRDARFGAAELAAAIHIYRSKNGNYPESLDKLVPDIVKELPPDPFTGKNFIYRLEGNGFIVYSRGENRRDDGGEQESPDDDISWKPDDISWKSGEMISAHSIEKSDSL